MKIITAAAGLVAFGLMAADASAGLQGVWAFDNAANLGQDTGPLGGNSTHTLAVNGDAIQAAAGKFGGALQLDGTGDFLAQPAAGFPTGLPTGNSPYTIAVWFKPTATGDRGLVGWGNYGTNLQVNAFRLFSTDGFRHYWWAADLDVTDAPGNYSDANWHHAVASFDGTTRRIYLDGTQIGSDSPTGHNTTATNFRIGSTNNGEFFSGQLDDVGIWDNALSQAEITSLQTRAIPEPASLVGVIGLGLLARRRRPKA